MSYNRLLSESVLLWNVYICLYSVDSRRLWGTRRFDSPKIIPAWHSIQRSPALIRNRTDVPFVSCMLCQNKAPPSWRLQVHWALRMEGKIPKKLNLTLKSWQAATGFCTKVKWQWSKREDCGVCQQPTVLYKWQILWEKKRKLNRPRVECLNWKRDPYLLFK